MKKGTGKNKPMSDAEKFEAAFKSMQQQVPKEYYDGFKKVDYGASKTEKKVKERDAIRKGNATAVIKGDVNNKKDPKINIGKVLDPDAQIVIKEPPKEISTQVQQARQEANLSQDQLAKLVECKPSAIKDLEAGVGQYDAQLVTKIEKSLKKTFTRSWKK